jgi:hypothetical protein
MQQAAGCNSLFQLPRPSRSESTNIGWNEYQRRGISASASVRHEICHGRARGRPYGAGAGAREAGEPELREPIFVEREPIFVDNAGAPLPVGLAVELIIEAPWLVDED